MAANFSDFIFSGAVCWARAGQTENNMQLVRILDITKDKTYAKCEWQTSLLTDWLYISEQNFRPMDMSEGRSRRSSKPTLPPPPPGKHGSKPPSNRNVNSSSTDDLPLASSSSSSSSGQRRLGIAETIDEGMLAIVDNDFPFGFNDQDDQADADADGDSSYEHEADDQEEEYKDDDEDEGVMEAVEDDDEEIDFQQTRRTSRGRVVSAVDYTEYDRKPASSSSSKSKSSSSSSKDSKKRQKQKQNKQKKQASLKRAHSGSDIGDHDDMVNEDNDVDGDAPGRGAAHWTLPPSFFTHH